MKTNPIQDNGHRSIIIPITQGALIGAGAGIVGKYALPLTSEEKNSDEFVKISNKVKEQKNEFTFRTKKYIDSIAAKENRSVAEDEFVKMFDGMKNGEKVKKSSIRTAIRNLTENNPNELLEFKRLCKNSSELAEKSAKQFMSAYNLVTKHIRPTGFFVAAGAGLGAFIALAHDVLKVRVNN